VDAISEPIDPIEPSPAPPSRSGLYHFFFGRFGLRAGWSVVIFLALLVGAQQGLNRLLHILFTHWKHGAFAPKPGPQQQLLPTLFIEACAFGTVLLVSWVMAFIERRRVSAFGLGGRHFLHRFLHGAFWGVAAISLLVGLLYAFRLLTFDKLLDHGPAILGLGALQLLLFLFAGLLEEYLFRGYIQFTLTRGLVGLGEILSQARGRAIAFWIASFITSAIFLYAHISNSGEDKLGLISVFFAGVVFVVALWRTGSLWWAIGFHMAWDWGQSFLYGVPDSGQLFQGHLFATHPNGSPLLSGGTVGPEGSVLLYPVLALVILVLIHTHPSPQPPLETGG
jgi:membrane protease YdiL (CAAX protease family)